MSEFKNKSILITGGAGFIGSNLAFYFQKNHPDANVVVFDCFRNDSNFPNGNLRSFGHYKNLIGFTGEVICGNIINQNDLSMIDQYKFDYIFHLAAISDTRVYDQEIVFQTNINSFYDLLRVAKKNNAVMVYASSAAVYGNLPSPQTIGNESPENPYGYSKLVMDKIATKYSYCNDEASLVGLRYFNVYGPGEFYKGSTASMIIQLGHQILSGNAPRLFENSRNILRDFVFIDDVIDANINAALSKKNGVYNIGSGCARSFLEVADILQMELNTNFEVDYFANPYSGYQNYTQADIYSTKRDLDYDPKFSLEKGINKYIPEIKKLYKEDFL
jgi:ADP-L-glycero-D-manno-heptose 6-epimerase